jgi:hypothetical protein
MAEKRRKMLWGITPFLSGLLLVGALTVLFGALEVASADEPTCGDVRSVPRPRLISRRPPRATSRGSSCKYLFNTRRFGWKSA